MITSKLRHLLLADDIARTGAIVGTNPATYTDGEMAVVNRQGVVLDTTTVTDEDAVFVIQGQGADKPVIKSDLIRLKNIISYEGEAYTAAVEQVSHIGFDGVTAAKAIEVINDNNYIGRILIQGEQNTFGNRNMYRQFHYKSDSSATQAEIAAGLASNLIANTSKDPDRMLKVERINAHAGAALGAAADTVVATKGSKIIVLTDTGADNSFTALAAGDYIRLGTALTAPVYKVVVGTGTGGGNLEVDIAVQASASLLGTTSEIITAAQAAANNFGIQLTGVAKSFDPGVFRYYKVRFELLLKDFGVTNVSYTTKASEGSGTKEQVREQEWFAQGFEGKFYRIDTPPVVMRNNASPYGTGADGFSLLTLHYFDQSAGGIGDTEKSRKELVMAFAKGGASFEQATGDVITNSSVADVLDAWISDFPDQAGTL